AREKEVPSGASDDKDDIRPDAQDVARRRNEAESARLLGEYELRVGCGAALTGKTLCGSLLFGFVLDAGGPLRRVRVGEWRHPTARRLPQATDQARQHESREREAGQ